MVKLSDRMQAIANLVSGKTCADIGTDHAFIPIFLAESNWVTKAAACDIASGPLKLAQSHIEEAGLSGVIETRLGAGLAPVTPREFETLIIAGMGGSTIIEILSESFETALSFKQIIIQPQTDIPLVRKYLTSSGIRITDEKMLLDNGKFYNILVCEPGICEEYSIVELEFGKILLAGKNDCLHKYLTSRLSKNLKHLPQIPEAKRGSLLSENQLIREAQNEFYKP